MRAAARLLALSLLRESPAEEREDDGEGELLREEEFD